MAGTYYGARHGRHIVRDKELDADFWFVFREIAFKVHGKDWLAESFPEQCPDYQTQLVCGTDGDSLAAALLRLLGHGTWPPPATVDDPSEMLDYVEFIHDHISSPGSRNFHSYYRHEDLSDFGDAGAVEEYRGDVNVAFANMGYRYELLGSGEAVRLTDADVDPQILNDIPSSEDDHLDGLVHRAVGDFYHRSGARKQQALEAIVDAFERAKTLEPGDKKASVAAVIERAMPDPDAARLLDDEMLVLTDIGNEYTIRHHETGKKQISAELHDHLFYRYYNVVATILRSYADSTP